MKVSLCCPNTGTLFLLLLKSELLVRFSNFLSNVILSNLLLYQDISVLFLGCLLLLPLLLLHQYLFSGKIGEARVFIVLLILIQSELRNFFPSILWKCVIHYHSLLTVFRTCWISLRYERLQDVLWFLLSLRFYHHRLVFTKSTILVNVLRDTIELVSIKFKLHKRTTSLML